MDAAQTSRRALLTKAGAAAAAAVAYPLVVRPAAANAAEFVVNDYTRNLSTFSTSLSGSAYTRYQQTRQGAPHGDAVWVVRDMSERDPYKDELYITDHGAIFSSRWIIVSQKRFNPIGGNPANGARIQGPSSTPDGNEPYMIGVSPDVDGPSIAAEAYTNANAGYRNQSAFAAYDLDSINGGITNYSQGYGRKKFVIRGDGGMWWGTDLQRDNYANSDVRLERTAPGTLRLSAPKGGPAALTMDGDTINTPGAPTGSYPNGAKVVNTADQRLYVNVKGTWMFTPLQPVT